ncbi:hypothetical protein L249_4988 [Ophiocordyceps polyrhachis-furcata BCC 54312]|uniref:Uncharacterized protein n=1 Tax=Ophiocordyceps polyrhachis-furcata BCC 54312 TaxID=1330021 RepID=A0A367L354_9HYPO|nr:hypothetical protein L249_4988 [Ophiocordyceps polyrhachis-furcata BCC 54312]
MEWNDGMGSAQIELNLALCMGLELCGGGGGGGGGDEVVHLTELKRARLAAIKGGDYQQRSGRDVCVNADLQNDGGCVGGKQGLNEWIRWRDGWMDGWMDLFLSDVSLYFCVGRILRRDVYVQVALPDSGRFRACGTDTKSANRELYTNGRSPIRTVAPRKAPPRPPPPPNLSRYPGTTYLDTVPTGCGPVGQQTSTVWGLELN